MGETSAYSAKYKRIMLNTFKYLVNFLNTHNLRWYCSYGTLIGAVRDHGLIPWDDDIDICMPKDDFDKLISIKDELERGSHYKILSLSNKGYYYAIGKIIDTKTTLWEYEVYPLITGVYVDIFPLYRTNLSRNDLIETMIKYRSLYISYLRSLKRIPFKAFLKSLLVDHSRVWREYLINKVLYPRYRSNHFLKELNDYDNLLNMNHGDSALCYAGFVSNYKGIVKMAYYSDYLEVPFEDFLVRIPIGYHEILSQIYGDYMSPPPVEMRVSKHSDLRFYINLNEGLSLSEVKKRIKEGEHQVY